MPYLTAIFGACHLCHAEFGHAYDQDTIPVADARAALGEKIAGCQHTGVGATL